jgi:predicted GNAT family N-acyltransferase
VIRIALSSWEEARAEASRIRTLVFVDEQRVPAEMELDEFDPRSIHALAYAGEARAVATGRLLPDGHIGRMAVLKAWRGQGIGGAILERLVETARARGEREVALSAQTQALAFYRHHGFVAEGAIYLDAGIPHQNMRRRL